MMATLTITLTMTIGNVHDKQNEDENEFSRNLE